MTTYVWYHFWPISSQYFCALSSTCGFPSFGLFGVFALVFSKLRFKFINKMETSWSRFVEITDNELIEFVGEQENTNIKRKTAYELFKNFIQTSNPSLLCSTSLHEFSPQVMNDHLSKFIFAVRKKGGSDYGPTSLRGLISFKHPEISEKTELSQYGFTIFTDAVFKNTMATLRAKQKEIKAKGLGSMHRTSDSLTDEEIEKVYVSQCLW